MVICFIKWTKLGSKLGHQVLGACTRALPKSAGCRNSLLVRWQFPDLLIQNGSRSHKGKVAEVWDSGCRDSLLVRSESRHILRTYGFNATK